MGEWHDFFLASAGAAGVLTGLVFVGVSINLEKILSTPRYGLTGRALEALVLLLAVLVVTSLLLVPDQGTVVAGAEVLAVGIADWAVIVVIQLLQLRNWRSLEPSLRGHLVGRVVLGQVATLPFVVAGVGCWRSLLARSGCSPLVLGCGCRRVGPARRDPPLRRSPGISLSPYLPTHPEKHGIL